MFAFGELCSVERKSVFLTTSARARVGFAEKEGRDWVWCKVTPPPPYLYRSVLGHKSGFVISGISLKTRIICSQPFPVATMTHERKLHFQ